ncbi:hypothetical protein I4F81_002659 [Pyropia yezoensis]|uniref:Uncharacterized protein n=1 Tax=Pyropia yezoensis TaxID=2788 RepID=A0ACC3BR38_PYRYE|nr:hypothetical protein I4F81_002659 [Neopyropia yezoensis]
MSACVSLQTHLTSRFGATGGASCFGTHYGLGNAVLHMTNDSLSTIIDANCCATRTQFSGLTSKTRMLMNIDTFDTEGAARTAPAVTRTAPAVTRIAPAVGAELMAGAKDIIFDLGQCCPPYFEFINQNDEHSCCHEGCWHMVDVLGMYFTMEECCADGANQSGTYVVCP